MRWPDLKQKQSLVKTETDHETIVIVNNIIVADYYILVTYTYKLG